MNIDNSTELLKTTTPQFIDEAAFIQTYLKEKSPKQAFAIGWSYRLSA